MKYTTADLHKFAFDNQGTLLSEEYDKADTEYTWSCKNGHVFNKTWAKYTKVFRGFCQQCLKPTIEKLQKVAEERGGKCLSNTYLGSDNKYEWECENGHQWFASWTNIGYKNATWCNQCSRGIWDFPKFQKIAIERGGKCVELLKGNGLRGIYMWECEDGHRWTTAGGNVVTNKTWCAQCQKLSLEDCIEEADKRGGKCLESVYINKRELMEWECEKGHRFKLRLGAVRNNERWCKKCSDDRKRHPIFIAQELAKQKGGELLSTEYINLDTPMKWKCEKGHVWEVAMRSMKQRNTWCPNCLYKSEAACREILEELLQFPLLKKRPAFLNGLELDGYSERFCIAFEYNGKQHYNYTPHFHRNGPSDLVKQKLHDCIKENLCKDHGISLIIIPSNYTYINREELEEYLREEVDKLPGAISV
jgi:hypothetical protein